MIEAVRTILDSIPRRPDGLIDAHRLDLGRDAVLKVLRGGGGSEGTSPEVRVVTGTVEQLARLFGLPPAQMRAVLRFLDKLTRANRVAFEPGRSGPPQAIWTVKEELHVRIVPPQEDDGSLRQEGLQPVA